MADYCSNSVVFSGKNGEKVLEHFQKLGEDAPPFLAIQIDDGKVDFKSRWIPPLNSLFRIAERFDVNFRLEYRIPDEGIETFAYTCMQQQPLPPEAQRLREAINNATSKPELDMLEARIVEHALARDFDQTELRALKYILGKRFTTMATTSDTGRKPWESSDPKEDRNRKR